MNPIIDQLVSTLCRQAAIINSLRKETKSISSISIQFINQPIHQSVSLIKHILISLRSFLDLKSQIIRSNAYLFSRRKNMYFYDSKPTHFPVTSISIIKLTYVFSDQTTPSDYYIYISLATLILLYFLTLSTPVSVTL